jgi:hypothetical protein
MSTNSVIVPNHSAQSEWAFMMNLSFSECMIVAAKVALYHQLCQQYNIR